MHRDNTWFRKVSRSCYWDDWKEPDYTEFLRNVAAVMKQAARPGASLFFNHKCRWRKTVMLHPLKIVESFAGWNLRQELIWDKSGSLTLGARMFAPSEERIYWLYDDRAKWTWNQSAMRMSVWKAPPDRGLDWHAATYPVEIPRRCIAATTQPGDVVCDPFSGSGTTCLAAMQLGRRAIGIEKDATYFEKSVARLRAAWKEQSQRTRVAA